jgi:invasion protein IalB
MKQTTRVTAVALLMAMIAPAWGQDEGTAFDSDSGFEGQQEQQRSGGQGSSGQGSGMPAGSPSGSQRQAQNVTKETYQDWIVRCGTVGEQQQERCQMSQEVSPQDSDQAIMRVAVLYPQNADGPAAIFQLPLGIILPKGIAIQVDDGEAKRFPVQICVKQGCRADLPLEPSLLEQMKAGRNADVIIRSPRVKNGTARLPISLLGFTAAFERVQQAR